MSAPNDGGPAFPQDLQGRRGDDPQYQGMSLRDWFAGQALANTNIEEHSGYGWACKVAEQAYMIADSMLAARERKEDK